MSTMLTQTETETLGYILRAKLRAFGIRRKLPDEAARWREYEAGRDIVRSIAKTPREHQRLIVALAEWVGV